MLILTRKINETIVVGERWEIKLLHATDDYIECELTTVGLDDIHTEMIKIEKDEIFSLSPKVQFFWKKRKGKQYQFVFSAPKYISLYRAENKGKILGE